VADECRAIVDDASNDFMERLTRDGGVEYVPNQENIARSRLRFDERRWYLSKLAPKRYGDRTAHEHSGPAGGPLTVIVSSVLDE
jgi:hypothetical protein